MPETQEKRPFLVPVLLQIDAVSVAEAMSAAQAFTESGLQIWPFPLSVFEYGQPRLLRSAPDPEHPDFQAGYEGEAAVLAMTPEGDPRRPNAARLTLERLQRACDGTSQYTYGRMKACQDVLFAWTQAQPGAPQWSPEELQQQIDAAMRGAR